MSKIVAGAGKYVKLFKGHYTSAFVAKAVLGLTTTEALIERLKVDRALRRICGFSMWKRMPAPSTFSRAFDEFAQAKLARAECMKRW